MINVKTKCNNCIHDHVCTLGYERDIKDYGHLIIDVECKYFLYKERIMDKEND